MHHPDVPGRGRDHGAIAVVEVEVPTAGEVLEDVSADALARRQRQRRPPFERAGVEQLVSRSGETHADRHDSPGRVEGDRAAVSALRRCDHLQPAAQRSGSSVGVGLIGVDMQVAASVGGHERMARHRWRAQRQVVPLTRRDRRSHRLCRRGHGHPRRDEPGAHQRARPASRRSMGSGSSGLPAGPLPCLISRWRWSPQQAPVHPTAPTR